MATIPSLPKDDTTRTALIAGVVVLVLALRSSGSFREVAQSGAFAILGAIIIAQFTKVPFWVSAAGIFLLTDSGRGLIQDALGFAGSGRGGFGSKKDQAEQACEQNGGVDSMTSTHVVCGDGTTYRLL